MSHGNEIWFEIASRDAGQGDADGDVDGAWAVSRGWDAPGPHGGLIDVEG